MTGTKMRHEVGSQYCLLLNTKEPQQGGRDLSHCADDGDEGNYRVIREEDQRNNLHKTKNIDDPKLAVSVKK